MRRRKKIKLKRKKKLAHLCVFCFCALTKIKVCLFLNSHCYDEIIEYQTKWQIVRECAPNVCEKKTEANKAKGKEIVLFIMEGMPSRAQFNV